MSTRLNKTDKNEWIKEFNQRLGEHYFRLYSSKISTWFFTGNQYGAAANYRKEIEKALPDSLIFMPVLDPDYLQSPECMKELVDYQKIQNENGTGDIMKVIIEKSGNTEDLNLLGGTTLVRTDFCDQEGNLYDSKSIEYANQIDVLIAEIRKIKLSLLYTKSLQYLDSCDSKINIFTALGFSRILNAKRERLLMQLSETLKRASFAVESTFQTWPDQLQMIDIDYESIIEMAKFQDIKKDEWLEKIIEKSHIVIVPIEFEDISEVEEFSNNILPQVKKIREQAIKRKDLKVFFLLNVPETMYHMPRFVEIFDSPVINGLKNFTVAKKINISDFIDIIMNSINPVEKTAPSPPSKFVYMIESNKAMFGNSADLCQEELERRSEFKCHIIKKGYGLLPYIEQVTLEDAVKQHSQNLSLSSGVIIYKGTSEDKSWSINQQSEIFKVLIARNKLNLERAIYLDPDEKNRNVGSYGYFNYNVLLKFSDELDSFLKKI